MYEARQNKEKVSRTVFPFTPNKRERGQTKLETTSPQNTACIAQYRRALENANDTEQQQIGRNISILQSSIDTSRIPNEAIEAEFQKAKVKLNQDVQNALNAGDIGQNAHKGSTYRRFVSRLAGDLYAKNTRGKVEPGHDYYTRHQAYPEWENMKREEIKRKLEQEQFKRNREIQTKIAQL